MQTKKIQTKYELLRLGGGGSNTKKTRLFLCLSSLSEPISKQKAILNFKHNFKPFKPPQSCKK